MRNNLSIPLWGLFALAIMVTLHRASTIVVPLVVAALLSFLFGPLVRSMSKYRVPRWLSATLVLGGLCAVWVIALEQLARPAAAWLDRAPAAIERIEGYVAATRSPDSTLNRLVEAVERLTRVGDQAFIQVGANDNSDLYANLASDTFDMVASAVLVLIMLFFLLSSDEVFLRKTVRVLSGFGHKRRAVEIARSIEERISSYLMAAVVLYAALGMAVGIAMWLVGMPDPFLWGALAFTLNFVPYIGPMVLTALLTLGALVAFPEGLSWIAPPAIYLALNMVHALMLEPIILGRRLKLNPVAVLVALLFWGWLWGVAGMLLAVPITAVIRIVAGRIRPLEPVAEYLGEADRQSGIFTLDEMRAASDELLPGEPSEPPGKTPPEGAAAG